MEDFMNFVVTTVAEMSLVSFPQTHQLTSYPVTGRRTGLSVAIMQRHSDICMKLLEWER